MAKQLTGWGLLILGVLTIVWTAWTSYQIFTGKQPAPGVFQLWQIEQEEGSAGENAEEKQGGEEGVSEQVKQALKEELAKALPPEFLAKIIDLSMWLMLAFILVYIGAKIAGLGIKLLSIKEKGDTQEQNN